MILKIILIVLGFGITIFVHEFGHFIMAKRAGVRVEVFSIGFGPKLWTFLEKGGTKYVLSLIPLGGYIKMLGQEDVPSNQKLKEITSDNYLAKTPWKRMGIVCAGVFMNFVLAYILMISALWIGVYFIPSEIGSIRVGTPAAQEGGFKVGDKIIEMYGKSINTFVDVQTNVALAGAGKNITFIVKRGDTEQEIRIIPEKSDEYNTPKGMPNMALLGIVPPYSNEIRGLSKDSDVFKKGLRNGMNVISIAFEGIDERVTRPERMAYLASMSPGKEVIIEVKDPKEENTRTVISEVHSLQRLNSGFMRIPVIRVKKGVPAEKAGLRTGDIITEVQSQKVRGWDDLIEITRGFSKHTDTVEIKALRGGEVKRFTVKPFFDEAAGRFWLGIFVPIGEEYEELTRTVSYVSPEIQDIENPLKEGDIIENVSYEEGKMRVVYKRDEEISECTYEPLKEEVGYLFDFDVKRVKLRKSFFRAFGYALVRYVDELKKIYLFLGKLLSGKMSPKMMGGPIQIANITYKVVDFGIGYYIYLFSLIGLSLAVLNMLPIPVLDGGLVVFLVYEMIRGKPASEKVQIVSQYIGLGLLLTLIVFVTFNDILRLFAG